MNSTFAHNPYAASQISTFDLPGAGGLSAWRARANQRKALSTLDAHQLNDIGLSAEEAAVEAKKWFWQR